MAKKKTTLQKLGLEPVSKRTISNLRERIAILEENLENDVYTPKVAVKAVRWIYHYRGEINRIREEKKAQRAG